MKAQQKQQKSKSVLFICSILTETTKDQLLVPAKVCTEMGLGHAFAGGAGGLLGERLGDVLREGLGCDDDARALVGVEDVTLLVPPSSTGSSVTP
jgi:hypothetical protein